MSSNTGLKYKGTIVYKGETEVVSDKFSKRLVVISDKSSQYPQEIAFEFNKEEDQKYSMEILPGAITDFYETTNDSLQFDFGTRLLSDYGNLKVNLVGAKRFPLILEVLDESGMVLHTQSSKGETMLVFETIEPKKYTLRVIYDDNANGIWDTGNFLAKRQAEEIIYFQKSVDVRANWDVEQEFGLD